MNKKALEDIETSKYKMDKQEPLGTSHMASFLICVGLIVTILGVIVVFALFV